jgi:hypothetical protein
MLRLNLDPGCVFRGWKYEIEKILKKTIKHGLFLDFMALNLVIFQL